MQPIVMYDQTCTWCADTAIRLRRQGITATPLQGASARTLCGTHWHSDALHYRNKQGRISDGAHAVFHILSDLSGFPMHWLMRIYPIAYLADQAYKFVANQRPCKDGVCALRPPA